MNFGDKNNVVVLSDVHIGTGAPTCWYQPSLHEPYLLAILDWVVEHASSIDQLVLLGDLFDFWTYPCEAELPSFSDIIAANPRVFGGGGGFARVLDALDGNVVYMTGNHDMNVTAADVAAIKGSDGKAVQFIDGDLDASGLYSPPPARGSKLTMGLGHGHQFTLFNAPDPHTKWAPMPVGHFVTRMVASYWAKNLKSGQTVADLPGQGAPMGFSAGSFLTTVMKSPFGNNSTLPSALLDYVAAQMKWSENAAITLPGAGTPTTTLNEVKSVYANLWKNWVSDKAAEMGGSTEGGQVSAFKAALADAKAWYLGWFAEQSAVRSGYGIVAMGHTHQPISGMKGGTADYINSGFGCPSRPDLSTQQISFAVIDKTTNAASLLQALEAGAGKIEIAACPAPMVEVAPPPAMDYSCHITLYSEESNYSFELVSYEVGHGYFAVPPPQSIGPNEVARFWLVDLPGGHGSDATVVYKLNGNETYTLKFDCPTGLYSNSYSSTPQTIFWTKSGDPQGQWGPSEHVATSGHPFSVKIDVYA